MKKYAVSLVVVLLALSLCACGTGRKEKEQSSAGVSEVEQGSSLMKEEVQNNAGVTDEEKRSEEVTVAEQSSAENEKADAQGSGQEKLPLPAEILGQADESATTETESDTSEKEYPGADVVEVVNLRGDETTIYKLADGTYMDRIEHRYTYNGTDTWTDEDGVEWNEIVR